jgi:hypothetical protein
MILRTALLRATDKLSSSEWHELQSLATKNDFEKGGKDFKKEASLVAESVKLCAASTGIEKEELMDLYYAVSNVLPSRRNVSALKAPMWSWASADMKQPTAIQKPPRNSHATSADQVRR